MRKVALPDLIVPELVTHLATFAGIGPDGFVFVGAKGGQLRRSNFSKPWARALAKAGLPAGIHVHDLRHTGNTLTEMSGVASDAAFGRSDERALPAVQRGALRRARSRGSPCTLRDLRCHHPPCTRPDNDAASAVASGTNMMQQAQPKSAATRADATTVPSRRSPIPQGWNIALYQFRGWRLTGRADAADGSFLGQGSDGLPARER